MSESPRRRSWRVLSLVLVFALVATIGVLLPKPVVAVEREMVSEAVPVDLAQAATPSAAAPAGTPPPLVGTQTEVADFELIGVEYASQSAVPVRVRVHDPSGAWGEWFELAREAEHAPDEGTGEDHNEATTEPLWVGSGDGFSVEVPADATDVQVWLIREGDQQVTIGADESEAGASHANGIPLPPVHRRSEWGAHAPKDTPTIARSLTAAIIHHTVNGNGYGSGSVPGMIRSIQAYHMDANGWDDIGYNFVVDRFGRLWEGRGGGITRNVVGAHARNHNTGSVGISFLGDFTSAQPTSSAVQIAQWMAAWKLQRGRANSNSVYGHRDVGQTSCPGGQLYARLGGMRAAVADWRHRYPYAPHPPLPGPSPYTGDFNGDGFDDILVYGPGSRTDALRFGRANGSFAASAVSIAGTTYKPFEGDFDGDDRSDIFFYGPGSAADYIWYGNPEGSDRFTETTHPVGGASYQPRVGDFDDDGDDDIFWYQAGNPPDYIWTGQPDRSFDTASRPVTGAYRVIVGDFDGDGHDDLLWYRPGTGTDSVWFGATPGGDGIPFSSAVPVGITGDYGTTVGDFDGDGHHDVFLYRSGSAADFIWYGNDQSTPFEGVQTSVSQHYNGAPTGDYDDDGRDDILWYAVGSQNDWVWHGNADRNSPFTGEQVAVGGSYLTRTADFNGDHGGTDNAGGEDILWFGPLSAADHVWLGNRTPPAPFDPVSPGSL